MTITMIIMIGGPLSPHRLSPCTSASSSPRSALLCSLDPPYPALSLSLSDDGAPAVSARAMQERGLLDRASHRESPRRLGL